jgi:hypothetical protein
MPNNGNDVDGKTDGKEAQASDSAVPIIGNGASDEEDATGDKGGDDDSGAHAHREQCHRVVVVVVAVDCCYCHCRSSGCEFCLSVIPKSKLLCILLLLPIGL